MGIFLDEMIFMIFVVFLDDLVDELLAWDELDDVDEEYVDEEDH